MRQRPCLWTPAGASAPLHPRLEASRPKTPGQPSAGWSPASAVPRWTGSQGALLPDTPASGLPRPNTHGQRHACRTRSGIPRLARTLHRRVTHGRIPPLRRYHPPLQRPLRCRRCRLPSRRQIAGRAHRRHQGLYRIAPMSSIPQILTPKNAPPGCRTAMHLWNEIERREDRSTRRSQAQLARDIELSLPHELTHEQHVELVREFVQSCISSIRAWSPTLRFTLHPERGDGRNHHAHILLSMRDIEGDGFGSKEPGLEPQRPVARVARALGRAPEQRPREVRL